MFFFQTSNLKKFFLLKYARDYNEPKTYKVFRKKITSAEIIDFILGSLKRN
jgi:hypothetical protein